jgi:hypothetical protein
MFLSNNFPGTVNFHLFVQMFISCKLIEISTQYCSLPSTSFNFLRLNLSIWNLYDLRLFTASLPLTFATTRYWYHTLLCMIEHQVYSNAFIYLPEYGQSVGFPIPHIYWCCNVGTTYFLTVFRCGKVYYLTPLWLPNSCKLPFPVNICSLVRQCNTFTS